MNSQDRISYIDKTKEELRTRFDAAGLASFVDLARNSEYSSVEETQYVGLETSVAGVAFEIYYGPMLSPGNDTLWCGITGLSDQINSLISETADAPNIDLTCELIIGQNTDVYAELAEMPPEKLYGNVFEWYEKTAWFGLYRRKQDASYLERCVDFTARFAASVREAPSSTNFAALRQKAFAAAKHASEKGECYSLQAYYRRSIEIRDYVLRRAGGKCEWCNKIAPFKNASTGLGYLEAHHILRLADGGPDDPRSMAGICPTCHREIHHGHDGPLINKRLHEKIARKEAAWD